MPGIKVCWEEKRNKKNPNRCNSSARWRIIELLNNGTWILMDDEPITESSSLDWIRDTKSSLKDKVIVFALIEAAKNNRKECVEFIMENYPTVDISKALEVSAPECIEIMTSKHDPFGYSKNTQNFFKF